MALRKIGFWLMVALLIAGGALVAPSLYRTAVLGSGVMAQLLCSSTFVSGRDPAAVVTEDLRGPGYEPLSFFQWQVERQNHERRHRIAFRSWRKIGPLSRRAWVHPEHRQD